MTDELEEAMKVVKFTVTGQPFGKQRPRVVKINNFSRAYTPKETMVYENLVKMAYDKAAKGYRFPDNAMLDVRIIAYYDIPKAASGKKRKQMLEHKIRPVKKPDFDNIGKIICDSLNTIAYHDDSAVVDAQVRKFYSENPRVEVTIKQIVSEAI